MKKIFIILIIVFGWTASKAQVDTASTRRTTMQGLTPKIITDAHLRAASSLAIPFINSSTPSMNGSVNRQGYGLQLLSNGRLAIGIGSSSFVQFLNSSELSTTYAPITNSANYIQNQTTSPQTGGFYLSGNGRLAKIGLGVAPAASINFYNAANLTGGANAFANFTTSTIQSDVTTAAYGNRITLATAAGSYTVPDILYNEVRQGAFGSGSSVTNQYGFSVDASLIGASNLNVGYRGFIPAGTGRYNLYMVGTALNYLNGNTLVGTTTDNGEKLQVNGIARATQFKLSSLNTAPSSATDTGTLGEIRFDANYIYFCFATNQWKRSPLTTW